jgi:hypothetical protein
MGWGLSAKPRSVRLSILLNAIRLTGQFHWRRIRNNR